MATKQRRKTAKEKPEQSGPTPEQERVRQGTPKVDDERFDVAIYRAWCKGCGICVAYCPREVLSMNEQGEPQVTAPERCTGCTWCELRCPDFAISVKKRERNDSEARAVVKRPRRRRIKA